MPYTNNRRHYITISTPNLELYVLDVLLRNQQPPHKG